MSQGTDDRREPFDYVDPFIDTGKARIRWVFTTFAARPMGMVRLGPNTDPVGTWDAGYRYHSPRIACFSHVHSFQLAGVPVMPASGAAAATGGFDRYASRFSHDSESAAPGYYAVHLDDCNVDVELTASERVGFHRYTFRGGPYGSLVFALGNELGPSAMSNVSVTGSCDFGLSGYVENETTRRRSKRYRIYFAARWNRPAESLVFGRNGEGETGPGTVVAARFRVGETPELLLKVGLSYVGVEQAAKNLRTELPGWDFDEVRETSRRIWNELLGRIRVEGGREEHRIKLYTDLWRTLVGGHLTSDVDGRYCDPTGPEPVIRRISLGPDGEPEYPHINGQDGFWNSQWSLNILFALVYPRIMSHYCRHLLDMYRDGGLIPRGPTAYWYTFVMISAPTTPFIVSAWQKGIRDFDVETAYEGMRKNALPGGLMSKAGYEVDSCEGGGIEYYMERGYIPEERSVPGAMHVDGAAQTLEYAYQDWALSELASALGKTEDAALFAGRSQNFRNLFDAVTGFMRPRRKDGSWIEPFDPLSLVGFCEANSWQYSFHAPQDPQGLIELMGGRDRFNEKLNEGFERAETMSFYARKPELLRDKAYVNYGNEPGRYVAHLFNHSGAPWLAQKWARAVRDRTFGSIEPDGFNEDDDQGKAAATSLLLSLGLFDLRGGVSRDPVYEITSPVFDRIAIRLDPDYYPGGEFLIDVEGNGKDKVYIQEASLNGTALRGPWIRHRDVVDGGRLRIRLGPAPDTSWGTGPADGPP